VSRAAASLAAGLLLSVAFPPLDLGWAAWFLAAPLIVLALTASGPRAAAVSGLLFGVAFHGATFAWWYRLLVTYGRLSHPEAAGIYLLLDLYVASYFALFGFWCALVAARRGRPLAILAAPVLWCALEMIRGRLLTGLPWSLLGATQHLHPIALQVADVGGVTAVSLLVAAGNAAVAWAWLSLRRGSGDASPGGLRVPASILSMIALSVVYGAVRLGEGSAPAGTLRVGLVQGNVPEEEKWEPSARLGILTAHLQATRVAAGKGARLVVWPESSVPLPLMSKPEYHAAIEDLAHELKIDMLVGSVHYERRGEPDERTYNSAFLIPGAGTGEAEQRYDKMHLVPYGEYVPLRRWLGFADKLVAEASDFSPGDRPVVMTSLGARIGPLVCFEAVFPNLVRDFTREGAEVLINITNDAFLGDSAGPRQHLALAALRSVESHRWLLRAANTGISAVIDDRGRMIDSIPYGTPGVIVADVPLLDGITFFTRYGEVLGWACVILALTAPFTGGPASGGNSWTRNFFDATQR
jgi:apolipoprotein N-acyltransferase